MLVRKTVPIRVPCWLLGARGGVVGVEGRGLQLALPPQRGETWAMPNCSQATCQGNNIIKLQPRPCPQAREPTCANGYPALPVADEDGCCHHYQCQCERGAGRGWARGSAREGLWKDHPTQGRGRVLSPRASGPSRRWWGGGRLAPPRPRPGRVCVDAGHAVLRTRRVRAAGSAGPGATRPVGEPRAGGGRRQPA